MSSGPGAFLMSVWDDAIKIFKLPCHLNWICRNQSGDDEGTN